MYWYLYKYVYYNIEIYLVEFEYDKSSIMNDVVCVFFKKQLYLHINLDIRMCVVYTQYCI
jgi:hypothetical protein